MFDLSAQLRPKLSVSTCIRGFYAVLDRDDETLAQQLVSLDHAGARVLQVRLKMASPQQLRATAVMARRITQLHGAALIINDDITLALQIGAEGVHLGQTDIPIMAAREQSMAYRAGLAADVAANLAPFWIGISTHTPSQVINACKAGANYIGCGPVYATTTKTNPDPVIGLQGLQAACRLATVPVVAIGGITAPHATAVYGAGAAAICAISAVNNSADISQAARLFARPV
ncbi:MAG: thiamine phosphate synthase [Kofleriaceae bacterium]|nr:thiamine phosphate synthase [Kofleriaceae bacterium]